MTYAAGELYTEMLVPTYYKSIVRAVRIDYLICLLVGERLTG